MDKHQLFNNLNEGILAERLAAFEHNLGKNISLIRKYGGLRRLLPQFKDKTVIVIGAGPSLERQFGILKKYQYRRELVYIATDMALRPLAKSGIIPRFVFSCETVPVDFFAGVDTQGIHLIAFSCMSHINLRKWHGDISFYNWMIKGAAYERLWEQAGTDLGFVATGNLVSTQAVAFAIGCGPRALVLVGNDLGYRHSFYARESIVYRNNCDRANRYAPLETFEMNSARRGRDYRISRGPNDYYTTSQFLAGKLWLEDLFKSGNFKIYDASEPGCSEKCVDKIELNDFFISIEGRKRRKRRQA